jgi:serine/threonine protein kinase
MGRSNEVDARADQWALAVTAYRMLSGVMPFQADDPLALLLKIRKQEPVPLSLLVPGLPGYAGSAIARAMSKCKEDRFASIQDFARAFVRPEVSSTQPSQAVMLIGSSGRCVPWKGPAALGLVFFWLAFLLLRCCQ